MLRVDMTEAHRSFNRSRLVHVRWHTSSFHICRPDIPRRHMKYASPICTHSLTAIIGEGIPRIAGPLLHRIAD